MQILHTTIFSEKNMLCCIGAVTGMYVGVHLGGLWPVLLGGLGFAIGLAGDFLIFRIFKNRS